MGGIFISYRREDSQGEALHLCDDLKAQFGNDRVFMDVTGIEPGRDFRKAIESAVTTCDALIVMIGRKWIDAVDEDGNRRLDSLKDFVRLETAAALRRDIPVIPVLVQGAAMPRPEQLPPDVEPLTWRNAFELRHTRWSIDVAELINGLRKILPATSGDSSGATPSRPWWRAAFASRAMAGVMAAGVAAVALQQAGVFDGARTVPDATDRAAVAPIPGVQQELKQRAPERQDTVPPLAQPQVVEPPPARQPAVQPSAEPPRARISMVGSWVGSPVCTVEIYRDDGETLEGSCDTGISHRITGRYTDPTHISMTVTRTDQEKCVTSVEGSILVIDRDHATFRQDGWNGCGVTTDPVSLTLTRP